MVRRPDAEKHRALVIVAAGDGQRLGRGIPKALVELAGRPLLEHALGALTAELTLDLVVLVLPAREDARRTLAELGREFAQSVDIEVVMADGAATRTGSVRSGVEAVERHARRCSWSPESTTTLIHDAARPLTPAEVHRRVADEVESGAAAVVPALPVTDTIKRVLPQVPQALESNRAEVVSETLPRAQLRAVQTPQGFTLSMLHRAFAHLGDISDAEAAALTDEAMIAEALGVNIVVVPGHAHALKITTPLDLTTAEALVDQTSRPHRDVPAAAPAPRVGIGHDVHAFAPASQPRELWLAGLLWPGEQGLTGHSDGDAVAHAACDALFSAAGIGDLGVHFGADTLGTDRPELEGASGAQLLQEAARIVRDAGFEIGSIAVQFIGNRPKFGPRREEAQWVLGEAAATTVSLSATTSDGLGFTGRGEGIMATATAVLLEQVPVPQVR